MTKQKDELFIQIKNAILSLDPVQFCQKYLTLDGRPFRLEGNGYRPFADIYRYIGIKALERDAKPVVLVKGRQVGATTMAAALELYFMTSGLFGTSGRAPIRIMHCFPQLELAFAYTKTKLNSMISSSIESLEIKKGGKKKSFIESKLDTSTATNDSLQFKQFIGGNHIFIESTGLTADRLRSRTVDVMFFDECFPYNQYIETEFGKKQIGTLYNLWKNNKNLPLVKSYNEITKKFEYKKILNACEKGERNLIQITCGNREIRCTENHPFLTENGWKKAKELCKGDLIKTSPSTPFFLRSLNDDQLQVALGSFLGDGHLSSNGLNRYRLVVIHGAKQQQYCKWKADIFNAKTEYIEKNGYSKKQAVKFVSKSFCLQYLPKTKTECPQWVLDKLDARGLAVWFMDDGSIIKDRHNQAINACISTCSFDEDSQKRIVAKLNSMGIECHYSFYKTKKNGYFSIYLNKAGYQKLCEIIKPYVHKNLSYKIIDYSENSSNYNWNNNFHDYGLTVIDNVISLSKSEIVYDIEVEDNHNFIITSGSGSKNLGGLIVHNCQDMRGQALANATKIMAKAQYGKTTEGVQVYFGTPKQRGTEYWKIWNNSSQLYYYLGCENCKEHFPLYTPSTSDWEKIWIDDDLDEHHPSHGFIVKCTHCGFEQDKRDAAERGKWIPFNKNGEYDEKHNLIGWKFIGYHINQLYMPEFTKQDIIAQKPENHPINTERAWQNEILGEFFAGDASPITPEEIDENCADRQRKFKVSIGTTENKKVYLGCDWGQKADIDQLTVGDTAKRQQGQSYSCTVILVPDGPHILNIEFATRLKRNDLESKRSIVEQMFRQYSVNLAVGDVGFANDLTELLQREYGERFLGSQAVSRVNGHVKYKDDFFPSTIIFEKDYYIAELYSLMKEGRIRFPYGDFEKVGWLVQHCCSMEIKPTIDRSGETGIRYVKGSTPNDGFMALLNAYLAYKFDISGGFSISNPNMMNFDPKKRRPIPAVTGYLPRFNPLKR